jgi:hypothetical protein
MRFLRVKKTGFRKILESEFRFHRIKIGILKFTFQWNFLELPELPELLELPELPELLEFRQ